MKIFDIYSGSSTKTGTGNVSWRFLADSVISNPGNPFFVPDGHKTVDAAIAPALRFDRLGKSIAEKFSHRYYNSLCPAIHFFLPGLADNLKERNLPDDPAYSFDKSLFIGSFEPYNDILDGSSSFFLKINGETKEYWNINRAGQSISSLIKVISEMNTIKIGDLLLPLTSKAFCVTAGDIVEIKYKEETVLSVKIK